MNRRMLLSLLACGLVPGAGHAAAPRFVASRFDAAAAHRLAGFAEANIDTLCAFDLVVAARSAGGSARIEEATLVVKAASGGLEFWFPVAAVTREGGAFRVKALMTPLRGEPEAGLERYEFNMLG